MSFVTYVAIATSCTGILLSLIREAEYTTCMREGPIVLYNYLSSTYG